jgi:hypothetical protein
LARRISIGSLPTGFWKLVAETGLPLRQSDEGSKSAKNRLLRRARNEGIRRFSAGRQWGQRLLAALDDG